MLKIQNLSVNVWDNNILKKVNLQFELWKNYCLLWKNWSWKSSLAMSVMGNPKYEIQSGNITFLEDLKEIDLLELSADKRSKLWIFVAFQNIPEIKWLKLFEFLRNIYNQYTGDNASFIKFKQIIEPLLMEIGIEKDFLRRDLNVWFSGWERRKVEVLQIKLLKPKYVFLDEVDSGLDIDAFKKIVNLLNKMDHTQMSFIVITHYFNILDYIDIDEVFVLENWEVKLKGNTEIIDKIKDLWYEELK